MIDSIHSLLDSFPEGVVQIRQDTIIDANAMARHYLPQLTPGVPVPSFLPLPRDKATGAGFFTAEGVAYTFSCSQSGGELMVLFRPAPQSALTDRQLDGFLYQLRGFLGEFLAEIGPYTGPVPPEEPFPAAAFSKSFHRIFRLMGNLEYMQQMAIGQVSFSPVTMDLDGLCREVVEQARGLLAQAGIALDYESSDRGLLIPGDPALLKRMLLGLIANSAAAAQEGRITLALRRSGARALVTLSDNGPLPDPRQLASLFQQGGDPRIPLPGQGAGLGLSIARDIVARHRGALLVEWGQSAPIVLISLPTGPLDSRVKVKSPGIQRDGGLDPVMVELSDVLPSRLFGLEGLD